MGKGWDALEGAIAGEVVLPGSARYETVRRPAIARFDEVRPAAVVRCRSAADVSAAVSYAARSGATVAIRSGGHCFAGRSSTRGMLIDVGPMDAVTVPDGAKSVPDSAVTIGAGARLGPVYDALAAHRLTLPAGCGPTVGIAGLTLGGGLGVLGRRYGPTSDRLLGAELVLADGQVVSCDDRRHADLFWALRGAGAGIGVVTSLTFRPVPDQAAASFWLSWPAGDAVAVVAAWQEWAPAAPDELSASLLITATGGSCAVHLFGAALGTASDAAALLEEPVVRSGTDPATSEVRGHATVGAAKRELARLGDRFHDDAPAGHPVCTSEFFGRPLPAEAIAALVAHLQRDAPPGQVRELDFMPLGGAYNRVPAGATAFVHRRDRFLLKHGVIGEPGEHAPARRWLARSWELTHPWGSGRAYLNFPDPDLPWSAKAYHGSNHDRLLRVKRTHDPYALFGS